MLSPRQREILTRRRRAGAAAHERSVADLEAFRKECMPRARERVADFLRSLEKARDPDACPPDGREWFVVRPYSDYWGVDTAGWNDETAARDAASSAGGVAVQGMEAADQVRARLNAELELEREGILIGSVITETETKSDEPGPDRDGAQAAAAHSAPPAGRAPQSAGRPPGGAAGGGTHEDRPPPAEALDAHGLRLLPSIRHEAGGRAD